MIRCLTFVDKLSHNWPNYSPSILRADMSFVYLIALFLLKDSESCKLSGEDPKITPVNSTHIFISWDEVFLDMSNKNVKRTQVVIRGSPNQINHDVNFSDKRVCLKLDPCLQLGNIMISLDLGNNRYCQSKFAKYNEVRHGARHVWNKTLYAGLLNKEIVQKTCLEKTNNTVTIPETPPVLTGCIREKEIEESATLNQSLKIRFRVVNPVKAGEMIDVNAVVDKLEHCPDDITFHNTAVGVAVVVGVSASVIFTATVIGGIIFYRKRRTSKVMKPGQVDVNPVYGCSSAYYQGRERMQVEDRSPYYGVREEGWEDFATDNNAYYQ